jgi:dipeptidyl aminopeptidase/acylaminoacyl peptidase
MWTFSRPDIEEFFRTYAITTFTVNKDETRIAFSTNLNGKYNVWGLDLPNTYPYPLSFIDQTPSDLKFDPQGRYILAGFDKDGDENTQLYFLPPSGGDLTPIRTFEGRRHYVAAVSSDGNRIYYSSDKENHQHLNSYVYDIESDVEQTIYVGEGGSNGLVAVSKDESTLIISRHYANTYMPAYVMQGNQLRCLVPDDTKQHVSTSFAFDKGGIVFTTNYESDRAYVARFDLETGSFTKIMDTPGLDAADVVIHDHRLLYVLANGGVEDFLFEHHLETGETKEIQLPTDVVQEMKLGDSGQLYVLGRGDIEPFNLFRRDVSGEWTALTNNRIMGVAKEDLSRAQVVHFSSYDGLDIESLWFPAHSESANGYTVVWPHGGPQASERRAFRPFFQFLCSRGYNVWAPNFRGSSGYGAAFMKMVEGDWGHGPRLDMVESIEWLVREGKADRDKLFLVGGSYGGYMTLLLHGRHADYFLACVDIFGPSNLFSFLESVPDHWKPAMKQWLGDAVEDKDRLTADSPITYLDGMTKPMLVVQGANDPRVVKAESDQIVAALRDRGVEVEYLVFDDEGHGFMKKANEMQAYGRIVDFLDEHRG